MTRPTASKGRLFALAALLALAAGAQELPRPLLTGRCAQDLPLDAGQGFDRQRFLVLKDKTYRFDEDWKVPGHPWRLASVIRDPVTGTASGLFRTRKKWRDGALWLMKDRRLHRWDPGLAQWVLKADPGLEFMDFEVDPTGRILLVATADPRTHTYRALLESVEGGGRATSILSPYPDPGCLEWGAKVPPVAAASLQVGYESVQILEFTVLFNPLARRLFLFNPLEDRLREVPLGLPLRTYRDLARPGPLDDLCWQVLPKDATEAWVVMQQPAGAEPGGLMAMPLDLFAGTVGEPRLLPGLTLPVFPGPSGSLSGMDAALSAFSAAAPAALEGGTDPAHPPSLRGAGRSSGQHDRSPEIHP